MLHTNVHISKSLLAMPQHEWFHCMHGSILLAQSCRCHIPLMPEPLPFCTGQESCSVGSVSQSGRSKSSDNASFHSGEHSSSLTSRHCCTVGWKKTPEVSQRPNRCRHMNGMTASLHCSLDRWLSKPNSRIWADVLLSRRTKGAPVGSQFIFVERMFSRASRQMLFAWAGYG